MIEALMLMTIMKLVEVANVDVQVAKAVGRIWTN